MDNYLRFTPAGACLTLAVRREGTHLRVSVADTGRGIPAEHLPVVCHGHWRCCDEDNLRRGIGSGLGLAIVKRILHIHGSTVSVQSARAGGSTFGFPLPTHEA